VLAAGAAMLGQSLRVTECLSRATEARRQYDAEADTDKRLTYLHIEQCWWRLACCYALMDRLEALMKSAPVQ
jgi:hypothetical protein